jgi:hypothetical protein
VIPAGRGPGSPPCGLPAYTPLGLGQPAGGLCRGASCGAYPRTCYRTARVSLGSLRRSRFAAWAPGRLACLLSHRSVRPASLVRFLAYLKPARSALGPPRHASCCATVARAPPNRILRQPPVGASPAGFHARGVRRVGVRLSAFPLAAPGVPRSPLAVPSRRVARPKGPSGHDRATRRRFPGVAGRSGPIPPLVWSPQGPTLAGLQPLSGFPPLLSLAVRPNLSYPVLMEPVLDKCTIPIAPFVRCKAPACWYHTLSYTCVCDTHARQFWGTGSPPTRDWQRVPKPQDPDVPDMP